MITSNAFLEVAVPSVPASIEAFVELRDALAASPEGGAAIMAVALLLKAQYPAGRLGRDALTLAADRSQLVASPDGYKGWSLSVRDLRHIEQQLASQRWVPRSYILDTSPETGYALPPAPYRFRVSTNPYSGDVASGRVKVFVACSGAASPRPVTLQRSDRGIWKASEWSSLTLGVIPPVKTASDDL